MAIKLKPVDVAVIGLGAAGGVAVLPLARAGLDVAALEAGMTPDTITYDLPLTIGNWAPRNDNGQYVGEISLRIPSLLHLVAMKLQVMKNEPDRSADEIPIIVTLLHANKGRWSATDLENACRRFGPPGIYELIQTLAD